MSNPQIPNPDQLEYISPRNDPRTNAARYEEAPPDQLKPPVPTVVLGPNAVYLVDPGYWPEKVENAKPEPPEPPSESGPVLSSIEPNELPVWAQDTLVSFRGENFTAGSVIMWNGSPEPTTFVASNELSTIVKPSTVQAPLPFTLQAWVVTSGKESEKLDFTFIT